MARLQTRRLAVSSSRSLARDSECEDRARAVPLTRTQDRRGKVWMVGRVGIMLRLESESVTILIDAPRLAGDCPVEKVPGIKLDPWLGREDVQCAPRRRLGDVRRV